LTIDRKPRYDDDDMKVITEGDKLRAVGKKLSEGVNGESIGFSRFQGNGAAIFVAELERTMRTKEGTNLWYLSAMNRLASSGADVRVVSIEGLDWGEHDYAADLAPARALAAAWQESKAAAKVA
jgi:choline kinase